MRGQRFTMAWYDELVMTLRQSHERMYRQMEEMRRQREEMERRTAGWLFARAEFRGVGAYRWGCTRPSRAAL